MAIVEFAGVTVVSSLAYLRASRAKTRAVMLLLFGVYAAYSYGVTL